MFCCQLSHCKKNASRNLGFSGCTSHQFGDISLMEVALSNEILLGATRMQQSTAVFIRINITKRRKTQRPVFDTFSLTFNSLIIYSS